jgi:peroxisomal membrane protein 4
MAKNVLSLTFQHARNLASFVTIYKSLLVLQKTVKGKEDSIDSFIAGCIGGYFIFGNDTPVNNQIVLYLLSRITVGLGSLMVKKGLIQEPSNGFTIMATLVWGTVMFLFRNDKDTLQGSLRSSMEYLYNDSDQFDNFKNWLWHNK